MFMPLAAFSIIEFFNVFVDSRVFTDLATMARLHINYAKMDILPKALFHALETVCQNYSGNDESRNEQIVKMKDDIIVAAKKHKFCREVKYNVKLIHVIGKGRAFLMYALNRVSWLLRLVGSQLQPFVHTAVACKRIP